MATVGSGRLPGNVRFRFGDGAATEVFTTLAKCKAIGSPRLTKDTSETTNFDSVGFVKEFIGGWADAGEVSITANWTGDASQNTTSGIWKRFNDNAPAVNFRIEILNTGAATADGMTMAFTGAILECGTSDFTPGAAMELAVRVKVSGTLTITAAPAT